MITPMTPGAQSVMKELGVNQDGFVKPIFLPVSGIPEYMRGVVECPRREVRKIQGSVPVTAATLWEQKIPAFSDPICAECGQCFSVGGGIITIEGILCVHPNVPLQYRTAFDLRTKMFHEGDPECVDCLRCVCPKIFMKPEEKRFAYSAGQLFDSGSGLCNSINCSVVHACFTSFIFMQRSLLSS
jgi:hypothetical protein